MSGERDERFMRRAIAAALTMRGRTWPNPAVGCVIVRDNQLLAEAATGDGGRPHAEEQALALAGPDARGTTVYVTLEPCGERSSGSESCSALLLDAGVTRVVVAAANPDVRSAGRGPERLRAAGVEVEMGVLATEVEPIYSAFRHRLQTGLPLVEAAAGGDGFDGRLELRVGETVHAALERMAQAGYARLWAPTGGDLAEQLKHLGLLAKDGSAED